MSDDTKILLITLVTATNVHIITFAIYRYVITILSICMPVQTGVILINLAAQS